MQFSPDKSPQRAISLKLAFPVAGLALWQSQVFKMLHHKIPCWRKVQPTNPACIYDGAEFGKGKDKQNKKIFVRSVTISEARLKYATSTPSAELANQK